MHPVSIPSSQGERSIPATLMMVVFSQLEAGGFTLAGRGERGKFVKKLVKSKLLLYSLSEGKNVE